MSEPKFIFKAPVLELSDGNQGLPVRSFMVAAMPNGPQQVVAYFQGIDGNVRIAHLEKNKWQHMMANGPWVVLQEIKDVGDPRVFAGAKFIG